MCNAPTDCADMVIRKRALLLMKRWTGDGRFHYSALESQEDILPIAEKTDDQHERHKHHVHAEDDHLECRDALPHQ